MRLESIYLTAASCLPRCRSGNDYVFDDHSSILTETQREGEGMCIWGRGRGGGEGTEFHMTHSVMLTEAQEGTWGENMGHRI